MATIASTQLKTQAEIFEKKPLRDLAHKKDLHSIPFTALPSPAMDLIAKKKLKGPKLILLLLIIGNASNFQIKRNYLLNRVSAYALKKYIPQLVDEGYITIERVAMARGGYRNVYHTRSVSDWDKGDHKYGRLKVVEPGIDPDIPPPTDADFYPFEQFDDTTQTDGLIFDERKTTDVNQNKLNENKPNQMNDDYKDIMNLVGASNRQSVGKGIKVEGSTAEFAIAMQEYMGRVKGYIPYAKINQTLQGYFNRFGFEEMEAFLRNHNRMMLNYRERSIPAPPFTEKNVVHLIAFWLESKERQLWLRKKE